MFWAESLEDLPQNAAAPCVVLTQISGSEFEQRSARRALALQIAARCFGRNGLTIGHTKAGALRFFEGAQPAPLYLSHATRGGHSAVAVSPEPVGVDLELFAPRFDLPMNILHENEKTRLLALPEDARHHAFLKIWTAKEACLKLDGQGLLREPSLLEVHGNAVLDTSGQRGYTITYIEGSNKFICAVATIKQ